MSRRKKRTAAKDSSYQSVERYTVGQEVLKNLSVEDGFTNEVLGLGQGIDNLL